MCTITELCDKLMAAKADEVAKEFTLNSHKNELKALKANDGSEMEIRVLEHIVNADIEAYKTAKANAMSLQSKYDIMANR